MGSLKSCRGVIKAEMSDRKKLLKRKQRGKAKALEKKKMKETKISKEGSGRDVPSGSKSRKEEVHTSSPREKVRADPRTWGVDMWSSPHRMSTETNSRESDLLNMLCTSKENCEHCQKEKEKDVAIRNWTLGLHNVINKRLGKPEVV